MRSLALDPQVNLNWQDEFGYTPFLWAYLHGHVEISRFLLDFPEQPGGRTINLNLADNFGVTPIMLACYDGQLRAVEMLLGEGRVDVNLADVEGRTPLWWASFHGHVGVVKVILASERCQMADVLRRNVQDQMTAAEVARNPAKSDWESENELQNRRGRCLPVASLLEAYQRDPQTVKTQLRKELGLSEGQKPVLLLTFLLRS